MRLHWRWVVIFVMASAGLTYAQTVDLVLPGRSISMYATHQASVPDGEIDAVHAVYTGPAITHVLIEGVDLTYTEIPGTEGFAGALAIDKRACEEPAVAYWNNASGELGFATRVDGAWITDTIIGAGGLDRRVDGRYSSVGVAALGDGFFAVAAAVSIDGGGRARVYYGKPGAWSMIDERTGNIGDHRFVRMPDDTLYWLEGEGRVMSAPTLHRVTPAGLTDDVDLSSVLDDLHSNSSLSWTAFPHPSGHPAVLVGSQWEDYWWGDDDWEDDRDGDDWGDDSEERAADEDSGAALHLAVVDSGAPAFTDLLLPPEYRSDLSWITASPLSDDRFLAVFGRGGDVGWMEFDAGGGTLLAESMEPKIVDRTVLFDAPADGYSAGADGRGRPASMATIGGVLFHMHREGGGWHGRELDHTVYAASPSLTVRGPTDAPRPEIVVLAGYHEATRLDYNGAWNEEEIAGWNLSGSSRVVRDGDGVLWAAKAAPAGLYRLNGTDWTESATPAEFEDPPRLKIDGAGRLWAGGLGSNQHGFLFLNWNGAGWDAYTTYLTFPFDWAAGAIDYAVDAAGGLHASVYLYHSYALVYYHRPAGGSWSKETIDPAFGAEGVEVSSCSMAVDPAGLAPSVTCLRRTANVFEWVAAARGGSEWSVQILADELTLPEFESEGDAVWAEGGTVHAAFVGGRLALARHDGDDWTVDRWAAPLASGQVTLAADEDGALWAAFQSGFGTALLHPDLTPDLSRPYAPGAPYEEVAFSHTRVGGDPAYAEPTDLWDLEDCPDNDDDADDDDEGDDDTGADADDDDDDNDDRGCCSG